MKNGSYTKSNSIDNNKNYIKIAIGINNNNPNNNSSNKTNLINQKQQTNQKKKKKQIPP